MVHHEEGRRRLDAGPSGDPGVVPGAGRLLFARPCRFVAAAPAPGPPEVAFAGRSNVGKSSLINALADRRNLARVSKTPGRTRSVNVFDLGGRLHLIDLPGYGYARAGRVEVAAWARAAEAFLADRGALRRVCLLLDARRGPTDNDRRACDRLDRVGVTYQLVLTKTDKTKPSELAAILDRTRADLGGRPAAFPRVLATSSRTGDGLDGLRDELAALAAPEAAA